MQETQPNWFAVNAKPRQERIALEHLQRQGFTCFLPMAINPYQRRSAKGPRIEPLFPRYLFLNAIADQPLPTSKVWVRCVQRGEFPTSCASATNSPSFPRA